MMKQEYERIKAALRVATPGSKEYAELLREALDAMELTRFESMNPTFYDICTTTQTPEEEPVLVAVPEEPNAVVELTAESVRARLKEAAQAGIVIQPIIAKYVPEGKPEKFSSVPASKYEELMEELNNA